MRRLHTRELIASGEVSGKYGAISFDKEIKVEKGVLYTIYLETDGMPDPSCVTSQFMFNFDTNIEGGGAHTFAYWEDCTSDYKLRTSIFTDEDYILYVEMHKWDNDGWVYLNEGITARLYKEV